MVIISAGIILTLECEELESPRVLIIYRGRTCNNRGQIWELPKGKMELFDENLESCAWRELREEAGVRVHQWQRFSTLGTQEYTTRQTRKIVHWYHCHAHMSRIEFSPPEHQTRAVETAGKSQLNGIHTARHMERYQMHLVVQALDSLTRINKRDQTGPERWRCEWKRQVCTEGWFTECESHDWNTCAQTHERGTNHFSHDCNKQGATDAWCRKSWNVHWNQWVYVDKLGTKYWSDTWEQWVYFDESGEYVFYEELTPCRDGYTSKWVIHDLEIGCAEPHVQISVPVSMFGPGMFHSILRAGSVCSGAQRMLSVNEARL